MTPYIESLPLQPQTLEVIERGKEIIVANNTGKDYHGPFHAVEVAEDNARIQQATANPKAHQPDFSLDIRVLSGYLHDAILYLGSGLDENESAKLAKKLMRETGGYTGRHMDRVARAIISTTTIKHRLGMITHPLLGTDKDSTSLVSADMSNLGKNWDVAEQKSIAYFKETHPGKPLDGDDMFRYLGAQIILFSTFEFPDPEVKKLYPHQDENLAELIRWRYELGEQLGYAA